MRKLVTILSLIVSLVTFSGFATHVYADMTNPADPTSPMNPANPANPASPLNPANPANPANQTGGNDDDDSQHQDTISSKQQKQNDKAIGEIEFVAVGGGLLAVGIIFYILHRYSYLRRY